MGALWWNLIFLDIRLTSNKRTQKWLCLVQHCVFFLAESRLLSRQEDLLMELECPSPLLPRLRCSTTTFQCNKLMFPHSVGASVSFQPMSLHWLFLNLVLLQYTKMMVVPRSSLFPAEL